MVSEQARPRDTGATQMGRKNGGETSGMVQEEATVAASVPMEGQADIEKPRSHKERISAVEVQLSQIDESMVHLFSLGDRVANLELSQEQLVETVDNLGDNTQESVKHLQEQLNDLAARVAVLTRAVGAMPTPNPGEGGAGRMRAPEPRSYGGARDAKELENFLFDIEQYFRVVRPDSEDTKVILATMYLTGDAKLWWRTRYEDIQAGRCIIASWEDLKREIKAQFLPENVEFIARRNLRRLQQTGTVREYVKQFSALMLDIRDMSEKDKLFYFLEGLKPWAQQELQRRGVTDLASAQAAAERLTDYLPSDHQKKKPTLSTSRTQKLSKGKSVVNEKKKDSKTKGSELARTPKSGCFLCGGPHMVKNCPQKQALNALQASVQKSQTNHDDDSSDDEEEQVEGPRMGALRLLNAIKGQVGEQSNPSSEPTS